MESKRQRSRDLACDIIVLNHLRDEGFPELASELQSLRKIPPKVVDAYKHLKLRKIEQFIVKNSAQTIDSKPRKRKLFDKDSVDSSKRPKVEQTSNKQEPESRNELCCSLVADYLKRNDFEEVWAALRSAVDVKPLKEDHKNVSSLKVQYDWLSGNARSKETDLTRI